MDPALSPPWSVTNERATTLRQYKAFDDPTPEAAGSDYNCWSVDGGSVLETEGQIIVHHFDHFDSRASLAITRPLLSDTPQKNITTGMYSPFI